MVSLLWVGAVGSIGVGVVAMRGVAFVTLGHVANVDDKMLRCEPIRKLQRVSATRGLFFTLAPDLVH